MKLYDSLIKSVLDIIDENKPKNLNLNDSWKEADKNELIFKSDTAYELGGGILPGVSGILYTADKNLVNENEIILVGKDLNELKENTSYARIALVRVNEDILGSGNLMYQNIRGIDYTRYHVYPEGFMVLISAMSEHESVRISKKALKNGLTFKEAGTKFINAYLKKPSVEAVKLIFVTDPNFNYNELSSLLQRGQNITSALDHLMNKVKMDCHTCKLQVVCSEVEELCKEDFPEKE